MILLSAMILTLAITLQNVSSRTIKVQIPQGTLAGEVKKAIPDDVEYYSFKGIPYAKPPIGKLRFKAPRAPESWIGVRDATKHGPVCPQVNTITNKLTLGSENCLFLNVYSINISKDACLPVLVSIPGGAYKFGSGNDDTYGPDFFVTKNVILVTLNHRLDALGFLSMQNCEVPGNAGLKDQLAALRWVQNNIKYFGGDPNQVSVIGESSAAGSIGFHLLSPMAEGLFDRAITMSGSPLCDWNNSYKPERRAFILGQTLGFDTENKTALLNFLQSVPYEKLINTTAAVIAQETITNVIFKMLPYPPVIEPKCEEDGIITEDPRILIKSGQVNKVDIMFSYNEQEALLGLSHYKTGALDLYKRYPELLVPSKILLNSTADQTLALSEKIKQHYLGDKRVSFDNFKEFINYANSASFIYGTQKFYRILPRVGNLYCFKFSSYSSRNYFGLQAAQYGIIGASHYDDIYYIYNPNALNMTLHKNTLEYKLVQDITTAITNFVKYGNPNCNAMLGVEWPQFDTQTLPCVRFATNVTLEHALDEEDYQFWDAIYEEAGMTL